MSEPTDAERLIREARAESAARNWGPSFGLVRDLCNALEAAIKERDEAERDRIDHNTALLLGADDELKAINAKLTEENRVLRKYMRDAEEMLRKPHDPFVMVNAANLLNQGLAETARAQPAGANDDDQ